MLFPDPKPDSLIRILNFYPSRIPDPGVKKTPDPGSATPKSVFGHHQIYRNKWNHTRLDVAEVHQGQIQGGQQAVGRHARRVTHVQSHLEK